MIIRNSALRDFKSCHRKFRFRWKHGYVPKELANKNLLLGQFVHLGLAAWHTTQRLGAAQGAIADEAKRIVKSYGGLAGLNEKNIATLEYCHGTAQAMLTGYASRYPQEQEYQTFQAEQQFTADIGNGHQLTGTIDGLAWRKDGTLWFFEHKTTSDLSEDYFDKAAISWQIFGYMLGARQLTGAWPMGVIYNAIGKTALKQKTKEDKQEYVNRVAADYTENPDKYFRRQEIRLSRRQLEPYVKQLTYVFGEIAQKYVDDTDEAWYPNTDHCTFGFSTCEYLPTCVAYAKLPDERFFEIKPEEIIHV